MPAKVTVGSVVTFQDAPNIDVVNEQGKILSSTPWDISGATITFYLKNPSGTITSHSASYSNGYATYTTSTSDLNAAGDWSFSWKYVVGDVTEITQPVTFRVAASP